MYVLMITPNKFPNGDAGAVRDEYFAKIYMELGYEVYHIGMNPNMISDTYKNIHYVSIYRDNSSLSKKILNSIQYKNRLIAEYRNIIEQKGMPSLIHIYDIPEVGIKWAKKEATNNNIRIVHDSVEWYSPCEFKFGRFAYPYILKNRTNKVLISSPIAVIAISSYLEKHFINRGLKTLRVPVIMDSFDYHPHERISNSKIGIVYAGSPAKKDYLSECIRAFCGLPNIIREKFDFKIFGADLQFVKQCCSDGVVPEQIHVFGRVARDIVISNLEDADFSILVRPSNERYTQAGFPTKSVEAMMNGCAMLCNLTSDLGDYLKDRNNAIIIDDCTEEAIREALVAASRLSHEQLIDMRNNARQTAEECFDYRLFIEQMKQFING